MPELGKILIYEFWYDYVKQKYGERAKLCYMHTDSFIVYIKTDNIYKDIAEDVETRFGTSNYELHRLLPKGKNKNVIGLMRNELGGKIMTKFVGLIAKTYSYFIDDSSEVNKAKGTKKCVIERKIKFENYKKCLEATQLENKINYLEKNKVDIDNVTENSEEFIKTINQYLKYSKSERRGERHNVFPEKLTRWL